MAPHDHGVNFQTLLAAVANQHELHLRIKTEDQLDLFKLACAMLGQLEHFAHAQFAQQQRAERNALYPEEFDQRPEQMPRLPET